MDYYMYSLETQRLLVYGYGSFLTMIGIGVMFYLLFMGGSHFLKVCFCDMWDNGGYKCKKQPPAAETKVTKDDIK